MVVRARVMRVRPRGCSADVADRPCVSFGFNRRGRSASGLTASSTLNGTMDHILFVPVLQREHSGINDAMVPFFAGAQDARTITARKG